MLALSRLNFPKNLPVSTRAKEIGELLTENQIIIISGDTGSGKTTQLPKICLAAGFGRRGVIGHCQPRRLAATSVASRIASELNSQLGKGGRAPADPAMRHCSQLSRPR